jgi:hypothetical protein
MERHLMLHQHDRNRADTIDYLQSMLGQLKMMADSEGFDMLAYLIDMAHLEARDLDRLNQPAGQGGPDRKR